MRQERYRDIVAVAVTMAFVGLGVFFLSDSHSAARYTSAQSGVTRGKYSVTNDSWNARHYRGVSQTLFVWQLRQLVHPLRDE